MTRLFACLVVFVLCPLRAQAFVVIPGSWNFHPLDARSACAPEDWAKVLQGDIDNDGNWMARIYSTPRDAVCPWMRDQAACSPAIYQGDCGQVRAATGELILCEVRYGPVTAWFVASLQTNAAGLNGPGNWVELLVDNATLPPEQRSCSTMWDGLWYLAG